MAETYWTQLSFEAWKALEAESKLRGKSSDEVASEIILSSVSGKAREMAEMMQPQEVFIHKEDDGRREQGQFHHGAPGYR
jgi:dihydroxyacetone kinase